MAKKRMKIAINEAVQNRLSVVFDELSARGAEDFDLGEILTRLIELPEAQKVIDNFVNDNTPESYKIHELLKTPGEREKILELLKDKSFGLGVAMEDVTPEAEVEL